MNQLEREFRVHADLDGMTSTRIISSIGQSQKAMNKLLGTCLGHHGMTVPQWLFLGTLAEGPQTPSVIAKVLNIKPPYIAILTRQIREVGDFVRETAISHDTRKKILTLTPAGKSFVEELESNIQVCIQRELVQKIAPTDLGNYLKVSSFIAKNVKHHDM